MSLSSLPFILVAGVLILFLIYRQFVVRPAGSAARS